ncbi:MAG TPA: PAS domain S-box protein [Verrucomicrobiae bacterium]|jgi:PAS domain S-box-containing protein
MKISPRAFFRNLPIHRKMVLVTLCVCAVVLVVASAALFWFQSIQYRNSFAVELESLGAITAQNSAGPLAAKDAKAADALLAPFKLKPQIVGAYVFDSENQPFGIFHTEEPNAAIPPGAPDGTVAFANGYAILRMPIMEGAHRLGTLHLRANFRKRYIELLTVYAGVLAAVLAASALLILVLSAQMQRLVAKPIVALAEVARQITESEHYSMRARESGQDEVGHLTRDFNRMIERIQSREAALRKANGALQAEIAERETAQAAQTRLIAIIEGTTDLVASMSPGGHCLFVNGAGLRMAGFSKETDYSSLRIWDFYPEWVRPVILEEGLPAAERNGSWIGETAILVRDGKEIPVSQLILAHRGPDGAVEYFSTIARDITESKMAAALRVSQQRYEVAVLGSRDGLWDWDLLANQVYFAPRWKSILGYGNDELAHSFDSFRALLHSDDAERVLAKRKSYLAGGQAAYEDEFRMRHKDGSYRWILSRGAALRDGQGEAFRFAGSHTDITERKATSEKISGMQKELLEVSRRAGMAEVATGVLHNVGNVLNSVNVSITHIRDRLQISEMASLAKVGGLLEGRGANVGVYLTADPKGRLVPGFVIQLARELRREHEFLRSEHDQLARNVEHIKEIVAMQQSYARVSGIIEIISLPALVEDALVMNSAGLGRHGINLVREFSDVPAVRADKHKVLQILINLVSNAKYALDMSGSHDRQLKVAISKNGDNRVKVAVADNGVGIPPENLTRIFSHGFTTRKKGHGFGLHSGAIAAKEMGGLLKAESPGEGRGATFTLELPLVNERP